MYWLISQFPELDHLEPDQRVRVLRQVPWWTYPLIAARAVFPSLLLSVLVGLRLAAILRSGSVMFVSIPLAAALATGLYVYQLARVRSDMCRVIAEAFRGERTPFCFNCGYDLRDLDAARCPECGSPVHGDPAA